MLGNAFKGYDDKQATLYMYNIWKSYDNVTALNGLSLYMGRGEILGLLGPNGSGKTTTMKIILGLTKKDEGIVNVLGYNLERDSINYKRYVGYVPEASTPPEYLTAYEFLYYVGRIRKIPEEMLRKRISYLLDRFKLMIKGKDLVTSLSKGMKQKLVFSSALLEEPRILLLDEPLFGVDPEGQYELKSMIVELVQNGCSVLLSTHLLDLAEKFCDRVAIINNGRNLATGSIQELKELAHASNDSTLEQLFLSLTRESVSQGSMKAPSKGNRSFSIFRR